MVLIDGDIALGPGDEGRYQQNGRACFVVPPVAKAATGALIGSVPAGDGCG
jgi:hypothetical protein